MVDTVGMIKRGGMVMEAATEADILLYLFAEEAGWQEEDARWYARLQRVVGTPLVPVMVCTNHRGGNG